MTLHRLFHPTSVCLVGASGDPSRLAGRPVQRLIQHRYPGRVVLVNPKYRELSGFPCVPSVRDIGEPVDVALVTLAAPLVPDAVRDCGAAGIRYVAVVSSGFEEDRSGLELGRELSAAVRESGVRLVGPNCEGLWSIPSRLTLTFGSAAARGSILEGPVSVISQSGSIGGACMRRLQDAGVGCRYFVSTGNETDLTAMDYLEYMVDEGGSEVVALFIEALEDGWRLPEIAQRAGSQGIRLLALRAGGSRLGRVATESHTGRIATAAAVYRDMFRQAGVLEVDTLAELVDATRLAAQLPAGSQAPAAPATKDRGVGVIAISGGSRALIADSCERRTVPLATFSDDTRQRLGELLPKFGYGANPADVTGAVLDDPALFSRVLEVVAADDSTDALLVQYANGAGPQVSQHLDLFRSLVNQRGLPVVASFLGEPDVDLADVPHPPGLLTASDPDTAVKYLGWYYHFRRTAPTPRLLGSGTAAQALEASTLTARASVAQAGVPAPSQTAPAPPRTWQQRMDFLAAAGVPTARWAVCPDGLPSDDAGLTYPVVVKALPETVEHKTEHDLVLLDLPDRAARDEAIRLARRRIGTSAPILLQEMVTGAFEALLAVRHDPDFGPVLAIGAGGVLAEWNNDVAYLPAGSARNEVAAALRRLRCWPLLDGYRGCPARDVDALVEAATRLAGTYLHLHAPSFEVELNPVMVRARGQGVVAVDVLCTGGTRKET